MLCGEFELRRLNSKVDMSMSVPGFSTSKIPLLASFCTKYPTKTVSRTLETNSKLLVIHKNTCQKLLFHVLSSDLMNSYIQFLSANYKFPSTIWDRQRIQPSRLRHDSHALAFNVTLSCLTFGISCLQIFFNSQDFLSLGMLIGSFPTHEQGAASVSCDLLLKFWWVVRTLQRRDRCQLVLIMTEKSDWLHII